MSVSLAILAIIFAIQLIIPKAPARRGLFGVLVFTIATLVIFSFAIYQSWQQYLLWKSNDLGKLFLPPYQSWDYFVFYARSRFFNPYLLSLTIGLVSLIAARYFNKKYQERFFEPIEPYLLATSIFLVGHPLWLFYLITLSVITVIFSLVNGQWSMVNGRRLSLYYLWLPAAIFTIIIGKWLSALPWFQMLRF